MNTKRGTHLYFLLFGISIALSVAVSAQVNNDLIKSIEVTTLTHGRDTGITWFLPRVCSIPTQSGMNAFMTIQQITGSDYYGPVHSMESTDQGLNWSTPKPIPGLGRKSASENMEEAVSDVISQYHHQTNTLLSIGEILYYRNGKFFKDQPPRYPVYITRDQQGHWSERQKLEWNDPRPKSIYGAGSSQFVIKSNGDLIIPVTFRISGKPDAAVTTLLCSFDGYTIQVKKSGVELNNNSNRGLLEPQLTQLGKRFYLTIRAEDGHGYVSTSKDGLHWSKQRAWSWNDGDSISMSTTQQHWLSHNGALYLVYTRKDEVNANVMRWRAPLYLAQVDLKTMTLIKSTERIVFPLIGDGINDPKHVPQYGNFHVENINAHESWIVSGEVIQANFRGDMLMARVKWND